LLSTEFIDIHYLILQTNSIKKLKYSYKAQALYFAHRTIILC